MINFSNVEANFNDNFEEKEEHKTSFENKIIMVGLILFGACTLINSALIYAFFNLLNKM